MSDDTFRRVDLARIEKGRYVATNARGGTIVLGGGGEDEAFTPVELLLTAIAGCSAADVDWITAKRSEPSGFSVTITGHKVRDDNGNHMEDLRLSFAVDFPDDEGGTAARQVLPRAVAQSHDRLCTVSRTVEMGAPIEVVIADAAGPGEG